MADYINPSNYPFVDFSQNPHPQVVDYTGPYGSGYPLAFQEMLEIANDIGVIQSGMSLVGPDRMFYDEPLDHLHDLDGGGDETLYQGGIFPITLMLRFQSLDAQFHTDSLRGRVFSTAPSEHAFIVFDQEHPDWEYGVLEKFGTLKETWATDGYVYSQTYAHRNRGTPGIKCFKAGEPLWHAPFDAMKTDLQGIEAIWTVAGPASFGDFVDKDGNATYLSTAYYYNMRCSIERIGGEGAYHWKVDSTFEQEAKGYKYNGENGIFDVSAFNVPWSNGIKYNSIVRQIAIPVKGDVLVRVDLGDPDNPDRTEIIFEQDYIGCIVVPTTSNTTVWSKLNGYVGYVAGIAKEYVEGAFDTIQNYSTDYVQANYEIYAGVRIGYVPAGNNAAIF